MLYYKKSEQMAFRKKKKRLEISLVMKQPFKYHRAPPSTSHLLATRMGVHSHSSKKSAEKKGPRHDQ